MAKKRRKTRSSRRTTAASKAKRYRAAARKRRLSHTRKSRRKVGTPTKASGKPTPALKLSPKLAKRLQEQNRKAEGLMVRGRARGFVTYDEILKSFPTIEVDVLFLEELYERFASAGIDVLEGGGMLELKEEPEVQGYSRSDSQYDSIQMYLREIGKYPLLNAEE
jgi:RNA polymerase primary sigma factor